MTEGIRNRIVRHENIPSSELLDNEGNWRTHPQAQVSAMSGILREVGIVQGLVVYRSERHGGRYVVIDGHLRKNHFPADWPCAVTDLTDAEADKILLTLDPLAALAEADKERVEALLESVRADDEGLAKLLEDLRDEYVTDDSGRVELRPLDTKPPPRMAWVLVGIPTVRFGEIAAQVERIAAVQGIFCETTANDGPPQKD